MEQAIVTRSWNPLNCYGTPLPPLYLLCAKCIVLVSIVPWGVLQLSGTRKVSSVPFLPFIPIFNLLKDSEFFGDAIFYLSFFSAVILLCNRAVRLTSFVAGFCFALPLFYNRLQYQNNILYLSLILILIGLHNKHSTAIMRSQVFVLYFSSGINKLLDADWRSGDFMQYFLQLISEKKLFYGHYGIGATMRNTIESTSYSKEIYLSLCWIAILAEFALAITLVTRRYRYYGISLGILFHMCLSLIAGTTFLFFFYVGPLAYLTLVEQKAQTTLVAYNPQSLLTKVLAGFLTSIDFGKESIWMKSPTAKKNVLLQDVSTGETNLSVFKSLLSTNPAFFLILWSFVILLSRSYLFLGDDNPSSINMAPIFFIYGSVAILCNPAFEKLLFWSSAKQTSA